MSDFTNKIKELGNKNQELSNELPEISKSINPEKIKQDIKEIAEKVITQDIEDKVKEIQKNAFQKLDKLVDEKIQIINIEKDDINSKFEDRKMKVKSDIALEKASLEQKIDTLTSDLKKANDNINQLKRSNDSKTDKLKNVEEANKERLQTLKNYKENNTALVQEQLDKFKNESLIEEKIQKSVIEFMEQQSNMQTKIAEDTKKQECRPKSDTEFNYKRH